VLTERHPRDANVLKRHPKVVFLSGYSGGQVNPATGDFVFNCKAIYVLSADGIALHKPAIFSGSMFGALRSIREVVAGTADDNGIANSLINPATGQAFPGHIIPQSLITADGRAIAKVYERMIGLAATYTDAPIANNTTFQLDFPFDFRQDLIRDAAGQEKSRNFYWLSTTPETLEWEKGTWYTTPTKTFANYTALQSLPPVALKVTSKSGDGTTTVSVSNPTKSLAFAVHLKVKNDIDGEEILPVLWEDNYFALTPGETREITATYAPLSATLLSKVELVTP
jgi:hypothetical protein